MKTSFILPFITLLSLVVANIIIDESDYTSEAGSANANARKTPQEPACTVRSYIIRSDVHLRYATTLLQVRVLNQSKRRYLPHCLVQVMVPEAAFVTSLLVEVGNRVLHSVVTTRAGEEEASEHNSEYEPPQQQQSEAFKVPRDSKLVRMTVSLAPREEATFYVTYEQMVSRRLGIYELVLNLHPGQVVPELRAEAYIYETNEFAVLRVPGLRSGHEIDPLEIQSEFPLAKVRRLSPREAQVTFSPTQAQQLQMANSRTWIRDPKSKAKNEGVAGQLVVQFEVVRERDGEIAVHDGYFAHHYAPYALSVLPKHVVFVLDLSSSMEGRKIKQLKTAMIAILDELRHGDFFSIIQFNSFKSVWSPYGKVKKRNKHSRNKQASVSRVVPVTSRYISKAKKYISQLEAMGGTNIQRALVKALDVAHNATSPLSLVVLLTDGETTVGESEPTRILQAVRIANKLSNQTRQIPIYSLAFGVEADFPFLRRLSAENFGSARRIYDAGDAALQLHEVYAELSSPVLADVKMDFPENVVEPASLTQHRFAAAYLGSELVVAGKLSKKAEGSAVDGGASEMWGEVQGHDATGVKASLHSPAAADPNAPRTLSPPLPRLWAYLTVQQLLLGGAASSDARQEATQLALEYSFVTSTTTLLLHSENDQPIVDGQVTIALPASQEIGSETRGRGGDDACSEGGGGEYWFPLQQAFIPCGDRRATPAPSAAAYPAAPQQAPPRSLYRPSLESTKATKRYQLTSLDELAWLADVRYGHRYLVLPKGRAGADQLFSLGLNETNTAYLPCLSPVHEPSHCRHLHFCPLQDFAENYHYFLHFFCPIHHFAGVCCPDTIFAKDDIYE